MSHRSCGHIYAALKYDECNSFVLSPSSVEQFFKSAKLMKKANYTGFEIKFYTALPRKVEVWLK